MESLDATRTGGCTALRTFIGAEILIASDELWGYDYRLFVVILIMPEVFCIKPFVNVLVTTCASLFSVSVYHTVVLEYPVYIIDTSFCNE